MASGTVLKRKDGSVPLCGDTIAIPGGGAVGIELMVHFPGHGVSSRLLLPVEG
jgi:hypothetical protein